MKYINNNTCGVYGIFEAKKRNVLYVGSSKDLQTRFNGHKSQLINKSHPNDRLLSLSNHYGVENLIFKVLLYCDRDELLFREMQMIKFFNPLCNMVTGNIKHDKLFNMDESYFLIKSYISGPKVKTTDIAKKIYDETKNIFSPKKIGTVLLKMGYKSYQAPSGERFHVINCDLNLTEGVKNAIESLTNDDKIHISDIVSRLDFVAKSYQITEVLKYLGYESFKGEDNKIYYSKK